MTENVSSRAEKLRRPARRESILDAAMEMLETADLQLLTVVGIADHMQLSRQSIYSHFDNIEEIIGALFGRLYGDFFADDNTENASAEAIADLLLNRVQQMLEMPMPVHRLVADAFYSSSNELQWRNYVRTRVAELAQVKWAIPLIRAGLEPEIVTSALYSLFAAALKLRAEIATGLVTKGAAELQLSRMVHVLLVNR